MVQVRVPAPLAMFAAKVQFPVEVFVSPADPASVTVVPSFIFISTVVLAAETSANPAASLAFA